VHLIDQNVFGEALNRVQQDLSAANEMYLTRVKQVKTSLSITTLGLLLYLRSRGQNDGSGDSARTHGRLA